QTDGKGPPTTPIPQVASRQHAAVRSPADDYGPPPRRQVLRHDGRIVPTLVVFAERAQHRTARGNELWTLCELTRGGIELDERGRVAAAGWHGDNAGHLGTLLALTH